MQQHMQLWQPQMQIEMQIGKFKERVQGHLPDT